MSREGWINTTWGELATLEYGKSLKDYQKFSGKIPVYGTNGLIGYTDNPLCAHPSVIIGRKGAYRGVHYSGGPFFVIDTAFYLKPRRNDLDVKYAYYQLLTQDINSMDSGSAIPSTSREDFYSLELSLPSLPIQRRIAGILSALDDKIELNRQTNVTLEAITQAIFKEWFVDFNFPGATGELVESELGMIPKKWKVGCLEDILILQRGFDLPAHNRIPGKYPVIAASGLCGTHHEFMVKGPGVTTGRSGILGNVYYIHEDFWPLNTSLWIKEFKHSTPIYAFHLLRGLNLSTFNAGSAVPTLNRNHVHNLPAMLPPMEIIYSFDQIISPIMKKQREHIEESSILVAIRDTLLPKLMSGEIEV
jgi:type I restriction enzyme, S subunit